jgi:hypothetical protein
MIFTAHNKPAASMRGINESKLQSDLQSEKQKENINQVNPALRLPAGRWL